MSGFIMFFISSDLFGKQGAVRSFLIRRVIRVAPIYWIFTTVYVLLLVVAPAAFNADRFDLIHSIKSYLFLPSANSYTGSPYPVLTPGWTLQFEMYFYAVFAFFLFLPKRFFLPGISALFIGFSRRDNGYVHSHYLLDLFKVDLGKDYLLRDAERVVARDEVRA